MFEVSSGKKVAEVPISKENKINLITYDHVAKVFYGFKLEENETLRSTFKVKGFEEGDN